ncbi:esterase-like activity of phytase family protein [Pendulispora albinea]|uniref:Esterase-like activity of phytase family protein n=1 Tax=Pendulispora albinea TaxID=2741071 RepID=A0ABZ2LZ73_9BACT
MRGTLFVMCGLVVGSSVFAACSSDDTVGPVGGGDASVRDSSVASDAGAEADAPALDAGCTYDEKSDGTARVLGIYALPATSLKALNPYLTQHDLTKALDNGAGTVDNPAPGSGLDYVGGCPGSFWMITDRGPNADGPSGSKIFPLPPFTPAAVRVHLVEGAGTIAIDKVLPIVNDTNAPVTGLPNRSADDVGYERADASAPLPYRQGGLDTEDIKRLPNGDLAFVDEYSPSAGILDGTTGKVKVRYVPAGVSLPDAGYRIASILPGVLTNRRVNKGLEGLAVSPDGHTAFLIMQTPMGPEGTYGSSLVNRVIRIDHFDDPATATVGGHFIVLHQPLASFPGTSKQPNVFFNAGAWISATKLLLLERGTGLLKLVVADFSAATNLVGNPSKGENDLTPEKDGVAALGIAAAATIEVFTSADVPSFITAPPAGAPAPDKLEGLAILNRTTVAIANDNDFGIVNANDRSRIWILRLKAPLPM